jgi:hypothetical protein
LEFLGGRKRRKTLMAMAMPLDSVLEKEENEKKRKKSFDDTCW